jgi:MurNAc alpha-1-phosphate uridylyltransferase
MKAIILSAGRGERMQPLTNSTPKPLLEVDSKSLIEHTIEALVNAGIINIVINYAHLGEQFPSKLGDGSRYNATIEYSNEQDGRLETAGGIVKALPLLGDAPFLVVNGDIWTDYPFRELEKAKLNSKILCHLVLVNNPEHNPKGDFSLASGLLSQAEQKKFTYSGIGIYHPSLFTNLKLEPKPLKPILLAAIADQQVSGEVYSGQWFDIGTVERLNALSNHLSR